MESHVVLYAKVGSKSLFGNNRVGTTARSRACLPFPDVTHHRPNKGPILFFYLCGENAQTRSEDAPATRRNIENQKAYIYVFANYHFSSRYMYLVESSVLL